MYRRHRFEWRTRYHRSPRRRRRRRPRRSPRLPRHRPRRRSRGFEWRSRSRRCSE